MIFVDGGTCCQSCDVVGELHWCWWRSSWARRAQPCLSQVGVVELWVWPITCGEGVGVGWWVDMSCPRHVGCHWVQMKRLLRSCLTIKVHNLFINTNNMDIHSHAYCWSISNIRIVNSPQLCLPHKTNLKAFNLMVDIYDSSFKLYLVDWFGQRQLLLGAIILSIWYTYMPLTSLFLKHSNCFSLKCGPNRNILSYHGINAISMRFKINP